ncbi:ketopantoate reductase family protein [Compostimonas suwonensis]|uniref:2-dehydropantoate 2-reductase n=1 Tax=Compostimonas suwonensis TaxID=1048394 RepID=A0A2M9BU89_9MICO|nr:2-dehydropantoate 2-reductase [Compostimonas suwonensis]PJJ61518.1 2-dehydropantoate 2-reductase [Compostimonas suwonensis]
MRIAVVGAGAVGGTMAALLDRAGHDVEVTARGEQLDAVRAGGLVLDGGWGSHTAPVTASPRLTERPDLALVATKAMDAEAAIRENARALDGTTVIVVQNGLRGVDVARAALPAAQTVGMLAMFAASYLSPGHVTVTTPAPSYLGGGTGPVTERVRELGGILREAFPVVELPNFVGAQWTKLLVNHVNAMPAITGLSAQQTIAHPGLRAIVTQSMREAVRVGEARGIRFGSMQGLGDARLRLFARLPRAIGGVLPRLMAARMGATPNPGSTLQSIRRGKPTEIDYLNGAVVSEGELAGVATPVSRELVALVHEVERTGRFLPPDEVVRRVPLG